jgi:hypothetical protein
LNDPQSLTVDLLTNELLVTNQGTPSVTAYVRTAGGNTAPLRTITGPDTALGDPTGIAATVTVPTLSQWAQIAMGVGLAGGGVRYLRRRRRA